MTPSHLTRITATARPSAAGEFARVGGGYGYWYWFTGGAPAGAAL
ncbi:MAG: hypothetical protein AWU55_53 [Halomonadaceae bacterium T82-2]|nr:MAG: hypothetical protein AWU55_53 [Halomonadaceae bacterium T82-2]